MSEVKPIASKEVYSPRFKESSIDKIKPKKKIKKDKEKPLTLFDNERTRLVEDTDRILASRPLDVF